MKRLALSLFLLALLAGCDSTTEFTEVSGAPPDGPSSAIVDTSTLEVNAVTGAELSTEGGHTVRILAGTLDQNTRLTLTQLAEPPAHPADPHFRSVGHYLQVDLQQAEIDGEVEFELPAVEDGDYIQLLVGHLVLPLDTQPSADGQRLVARFDADKIEGINGFDSSHFVVGVASSSEYDKRPAHQNWSSYNAYVFKSGSFQRFIHQGVDDGSLGDIGTKPVVLVHGFGSSAEAFTSLAPALASAGYTSILAFEYDTLSPVKSSGAFLRAFLDRVHQHAPGVQAWYHVAHSMGVLVSREAFEANPLITLGTTNAVFVGGANQGSPFVSAIKPYPNTFDLGMNYVVSNNLLDFHNGDGSPCKVAISDSGFQDLDPGSAIIAERNANAATSHPGKNYRTVAGTNQGDFALVDLALGISPEDGVINQSSANANFIGATHSAQVPVDHVKLMTDTAASIPKILELLN